MLVRRESITCTKRIRLPEKNYYRVLGLSPGATGKQIKSAYRKLALKYHPDHNHSPGAIRKFQEIKEAYDSLLKHPRTDAEEHSTFEEQAAREVYRREREKMKARARAQHEKKRQQDEYFNRPEWHDPLLVLRYAGNGVILLFAITAVILPVLLAIFGDPGSLAGTFIFLIMGVFLLIYIYRKRKRWFHLGRLNISVKKVVRFFRLIPGKPTQERCCYCRSAMADGKPYHIELLKTFDIHVHTFGALDHSVRYRNKVKRVVVPRSSRAAFYHRWVSLAKCVTLLAFLFFFPVESILWRFIAGLFSAWIISAVLLKVARVKSKSSYLCTPGLIVKVLVWLVCLGLISDLGPGFDIQISEYVYLVVFGLLFFLDMTIDLLFGFLPVYRKLFIPLIKQGAILDSLYKEGYQNYQELPVYSMAYPLIRWLF